MWTYNATSKPEIEMAAQPGIYGMCILELYTETD